MHRERCAQSIVVVPYQGIDAVLRSRVLQLPPNVRSTPQTLMPELA